jgi:hypothetical protein
MIFTDQSLVSLKDHLSLPTCVLILPDAPQGQLEFHPGKEAK